MNFKYPCGCKAEVIDGKLGRINVCELHGMVTKVVEQEVNGSLYITRKLVQRTEEELREAAEKKFLPKYHEIMERYKRFGVR